MLEAAAHPLSAIKVSVSAAKETVISLAFPVVPKAVIVGVVLIDQQSHPVRLVVVKPAKIGLALVFFYFREIRTFVLLNAEALPHLVQHLPVISSKSVVVLDELLEIN